MAGKNGEGQVSTTSNGRHLSIALSATITAIWGGLWGFNWAASHLASGQLFVAIIIGLGVGALLTYYVVERSMDALVQAVKTDTSVDVRAKILDKSHELLRQEAQKLADDKARAEAEAKARDRAHAQAVAEAKAEFSVQGNELLERVRKMVQERTRGKPEPQAPAKAEPSAAPAGKPSESPPA